MKTLRALTGLMFLCSGVLKGTDLGSFVRVIGGFAILPAPFQLPAAITILATEAVCGLCLMAGIATPAAAQSLAVLTFSFVLAIAMSLLRGNIIPCGCFGPADAGPITISLLFRDISLCGWLFLLACRA